MITNNDIQNLATLSRIEISEEEALSLNSEIDSILGYVSQIENMPVGNDLEISSQRNILRKDVITHETSQYTEDILSNAPRREGDFLKVKKIL